MSELLQYVGGGFLVLGALFSALAALGMLRFPDVYTRLHAASKAGALGTGLIFIAVALVSFDLGIIVRALLGLLFILLVSPLAAHILARAALRAKTPVDQRTVINEYRSDD